MEQSFTLFVHSERGSEFIPLDESRNRFDLCDAMYLVAGLGDDHYENVANAIEPILNKQAESIQAVIDGISYLFELEVE